MTATATADGPTDPAEPCTSDAALAGLWRAAALPAEALAQVALPGAGPVLPSSFAVTTAAQATLAAAALAAAEIWHDRHPGRPRQRVSVDATHATLDSLGWFAVDGRTPEPWEKYSGLYACGAGVGAPGWVRIHANFAHHRDGALRLLGLATDGSAERDDLLRALRGWRAEDFEQAAADAGLVVAAARDFATWDRHPQAIATAARPVVRIDRIVADGGAPDAAPQRFAPVAPDARPLAGIRVLDLTRILAGPVAGRTLAAFGADVMLLNAPHLPNIASIADTSRGKLSAQLDLRTDAGRDALRALLREANVFLQGYRPGGLAALGFGPQALARLRPGIVCASLSAYGGVGPWGGRRGFDSLVQTATGFNLAEAAAFGQAEPKALPLQILDYGAGYLLAFGIAAALLRQSREGGSWHVQVSLAGVGRWLRGLGRPADGPAARRPDLAPFVEQYDSGWGRLSALRPAAAFSETPAGWSRPSVRPGTHAPAWP